MKPSGKPRCTDLTPIPNHIQSLATTVIEETLQRFLPPSKRCLAPDLACARGLANHSRRTMGGRALFESVREMSGS